MNTASWSARPTQSFDAQNVSADTTDAALGKLPKSLFNAAQPGKADLDESEIHL
jgi:hypothetical protein